jgi:hypothetical protein
MTFPTEPSEGARKEALKYPNGYVYVFDSEYHGKEEVPPQAILGAWRVDEKGVIVGSFIPNPNHSSNSSDH